MQFLDNCTGVDSGHVSSSHFFLSVIPNVHPIQMCIKQLLFFGGVVADVGVIAITVIVVGIIVIIRNVPNFTAQCKFSTYMIVASLLKVKSQALCSV